MKPRRTNDEDDQPHASDPLARRLCVFVSLVSKRVSYSGDSAVA